MRRLFWLLIGAGLATFIMLRGKKLLKRFTPAGVAEQVERKGTEAATSLGEMYGTFKTAMAQREAELRSELDIEQL